MKALAYDLHMHSCLSPCADDEMTPNSMAGMAMLGGLELCALTDHNSCGNCPAFFEACERYGVIPVAGMELTTAEEIHLVCLFPDLEEAMAFDAFVAEHRMPVRNKPAVFGRQLRMDSEDTVLGEEETLLIAATDLSLDEAADAVLARGGAAYPAHIDRQANGLIGVLGVFPEPTVFGTAELHDFDRAEELRSEFPVLNGLHLITCSDAHRLEDMREAGAHLNLFGSCETADEVRRTLIRYLRGEPVPRG
jgi:hypothetical protein